MKKNLLIINTQLFLFLFFIFKYYIIINLYNKLNYISNKYFYTNNKFFFYILYLLLINNNIKFILYYFNNLNFFDINIYTFIEFLNNQIYVYKYKFDYLKKNKNVKIFFFVDFFLRIDILLFINYKYYMNYFRLCKYNEYLMIHPVLYKFPLLKKYLRELLHIRINKLILSFSFEEVIFKNFKLYTSQYQIKNFNYLKNKLDIKHLNLFFFKFKWFKFLQILKNNYDFLFFYFGEFFLLHLYSYIYNITIYHYEVDDWVEIKKFRIDSFKNNFWQQNRYKFNFLPWLYMLVLCYLSKLFFNNYLYIYNIMNLKKVNDKIMNVFWYKILKLILIEKINYTYFLWFKEILLNLNYTKRIKRIENYIKVWKILVNAFIFESININLNDYHKNNIDFNLKYIFWNIFFMGIHSYKIYFKYNINSIITKINIDNIIYMQWSYQLNFLYYFFNDVFNSYFLINFLFFFLFLKDLFVKIFLFKSIFTNILYSKVFKNIIYNKILYNQRKILLYNYQKYFLKNIFDNYTIKNKIFYFFFFEKNFIILMYIIIIWIYQI